MIKNIIFDLGGVLIDFNPDKTLTRFISDPNDRKAVLNAVFFSKHWKDLDRGDATADDVADICRDSVPLPYRDNLDEIIRNWWEYMPPIPEMLPITQRLKERGYKLYLLSNTPHQFYDYKDSIPALKDFDGFIVSCDHHCLKPEPKIYQILFDTFSLTAQECFFIDDMRVNTDAASALGMKVFCHEKGNIELLKQALFNEGVDIR